MNLEKYNASMYDKFGKEYQKTRDEKRPERLFNEFLEVPSMIKAVGNIKGKKLLDVGCGAGVHAKIYSKKGAKVYGLDISKTMIDMAKIKCPNVEFKVGSILNLPYKSNTFDIVTVSLAIHYVKDIGKVMKELNRVLKSHGLLFFSTGSQIGDSRETYEDKNIKVKAVGNIKFKKTGIVKYLGFYSKEGLNDFEMVPGMILKTYKRTCQTYLKSLVKENFELIDLIDCKPSKDFKKYDPKSYHFNFPYMVIYVARKK